MAGITLDQAQNMLNLYLAASEAVSKNQEYRIAGRLYRRANLIEINQSITYWDNKVKELSGAANGVSRLVSINPL